MIDRDLHLVKTNHGFAIIVREPSPMSWSPVETVTLLELSEAEASAIVKDAQALTQAQSHPTVQAALEAQSQAKAASDVAAAAAVEAQKKADAATAAVNTTAEAIKPTLEPAPVVAPATPVAPSTPAPVVP